MRNKDIKTGFLIFSILIWTSCTPDTGSQKKLGDNDINIFNQVNLYFDLSLKEDSTSVPQDSIIRLDAGRVLLKKIKLPTYDYQPKVDVKMTLRSNGDPWDKSGSLFVIPNTSSITLLDLENEIIDWKMDGDYPGVIPFQADSLNYLPNVELLRFMTPFGVGFFNEHERVVERKPVYIPKWEEEVTWSQDVTHLLPFLEEEVYIGVFIDTWTKEGYEFSVDLIFDETEIENHLKKKEAVLPLINTTKYGSGQRNYDQFSAKDLEVNFELNQDVENARIYYVTTGHGGHSTGDEFVQRQNIVTLNDSILLDFIPWRDDCASFRRFNPTAGVWTEKTEWKGKEIEERIASSDYSRSNWCPGSSVSPEVIQLGQLPQGNYTLRVSIPKAQSAKDNEHNYWMVSSYLVYE